MSNLQSVSEILEILESIPNRLRGQRLTLREGGAIVGLLQRINGAIRFHSIPSAKLEDITLFSSLDEELTAHYLELEFKYCKEEINIIDKTKEELTLRQKEFKEAYRRLYGE